ncbi:MAG TPA: MBL fold metallo-hydrolase [Stellaceae bacterium]|nr:MBL fold metallo-hydrolase [Stellaceae bacterium]
MRVTMLGCGPSWGVPRIGGGWGACDPADPRNRRRRCSVLVEDGGKTLLIDTSPDLREQLLAAGVSRVDAVLFTHAHADHLHGIDDLRSVNQLMQSPIPIFGDAATLAEIRSRFGYVFTPLESDRQTTYYKPVLEPHIVEGRFSAAGVAVTAFAQDHGFSSTLGFRIGGFAYSTDVIELDDAAFATLSGVEVWIVDCIRRRPHVTHSHLEKTLGWIARARPRRAVLTHMDESFDYESLSRELPSGVEPGHDGLTIEL